MFICRHAKGVHAHLSKYLKGCMLTCRNAEGVHGQRKIGNTWIGRTKRFL